MIVIYDPARRRAILSNPRTGPHRPVRDNLFSYGIAEPFYLIHAHYKLTQALTG